MIIVIMFVLNGFDRFYKIENTNYYKGYYKIYVGMSKLITLL